MMDFNELFMFRALSDENLSAHFSLLNFFLISIFQKIMIEKLYFMGSVMNFLALIEKIHMSDKIRHVQ
jgi:NAD/NADP transhydrogenase beta subunit